MTQIESKGVIFYLDEALKVNLDFIKDRVTNKGWDYVSLCTGLPGVGKSTFVQFTARYLCDWFNEDYIAFTDEDFIRICNEAPEYSSVVLDESFASLNSKVGMTGAFLRIINHLQLIRQKHLFIFLILPNFFDLSKGVAIFRSSHLFVIYEKENRRAFAVFDRESKKELYIRGGKYIDYNCVNPNFRGRFDREPLQGVIVNKEIYERRKREHLMSQGYEKSETQTDARKSRDACIKYMVETLNMKKKDVAEIAMVDPRTIYNVTHS